MRIRFHSTLYRATLGPAQRFVLRSDGLYDADRLLARYENGYWHTGGIAFIEGESDDWLCVHAEGEDEHSEPLGPIRTLRLSDGAVYADRDLLWRWSDGEWRRPGDRKPWHAIVLSTVGA